MQTVQLPLSEIVEQAINISNINKEDIEPIKMSFVLYLWYGEFIAKHDFELFEPNFQALSIGPFEVNHISGEELIINVAQELKTEIVESFLKQLSKDIEFIRQQVLTTTPWLSSWNSKTPFAEIPKDVINQYFKEFMLNREEK